MIELGGSDIPAHSSQDVTIEVRPMTIGEAVVARPVESLDSSWSGLIWNAWASAENQITIRLANPTDSTVRPGVRKFVAN